MSTRLSQPNPTDLEAGVQVSDPNIIGHTERFSQAGNAYVDPSKEQRSSRGSHAEPVSAEPRTRDASISVRPLTNGDNDVPERTYSLEKKGRRITYTMGTDGGRGEGGEDFDWELQADAMTDAKPIGYRDLDLFVKDLDRNDVACQATPTDLEKTAATLRGIILNPHNILWPTNGEFTIIKAEKKIEEYVTRCWKMCSKWYFHVQYLHCAEGCYRNKYYFEVKWSLPTKENPIPVATASVFFAFDVLIYGGRDEVVSVHYVLEGNRYPHSPGEIPFQQKWISSIICEKMRLIRSIKF